MSAHKVTMKNLSPKEIAKLKKAIEGYSRELIKKCEQFLEKLSDIGIAVIRAVLLAHYDTGTTFGSLEREIETTEAGASCVIRVSSDAILYLEFGSGIVGKEGEQNPNAKELGYGAFTNTHVNDPDVMREKGWKYGSVHSGKLGWTMGQQASMPMYKGSKAIEKEISKIAKKVFK